MEASSLDVILSDGDNLLPKIIAAVNPRRSLSDSEVDKDAPTQRATYVRDNSVRVLEGLAGRPEKGYCNTYNEEVCNIGNRSEVNSNCNLYTREMCNTRRA
jgi:hypothetical protein